MLHKHLLDFTRKYNKEFAIKGYSKLKKAELQTKIESVLNKQRKEIKEEYKKLKELKAETKKPAPKPAPKKPAPKPAPKKPAPKKETNDKEKIYNIFDKKDDLQRKNKITNTLPESKDKVLNNKILNAIKENVKFKTILNLLLDTNYYVLNRNNGRIKINDTKISFNPNSITYKIGRKTKNIYSEEKQKEKDIISQEENRKLMEMIQGEEKKPAPKKEEKKPEPKKEQKKELNIEDEIIENWGTDLGIIELEQNNKKLKEGIQNLFNTKKKFINIDGLFQFDKKLFNKLFMKYDPQFVIDGLKDFIMHITDEDEERIGKDEFNDFFRYNNNRIEYNFRAKDLNQSTLKNMEKEWIKKNGKK